MNKNYKLYRESDLSEEQIEADVASYLGYITPFWSKRFQLKAVNEQMTGADKLFDRFVPIYLQFKVSEGLKPLENGFTLSRPHLPLQKIRTFRRDNGISCDPTLYFKLRDKALTAKDFQHNILKSFHNPPYQFAFYVAPLTLSIDEYNRSLELSMTDKLFNFHPYHFRDEFFFTDMIKKNIGLTPFLRGHVSIPPHEIVSTSEHYYSYSKAGTNIAWHSGENINGDFRLSTQLDRIFQLAYKGEVYNEERFINFINEYYDSNKIKLDTQQPYEMKIGNFAYYLKSNYNISLMFLGINNSR